MSDARNRRGRPKGTGIDDRGHLQRIAAMLASDPELKPTTAIKSLGVTDPSIIRRLRDKFHETRLELMADVGDTPSLAAMSAAKAAPAQVALKAAAQENGRAMPARIGESVRKAASPAAPTPVPAPAVANVGAQKAVVAPKLAAKAPEPQASPKREKAIEATAPVAPPVAAPAAAAPAPAPAVTAAKPVESAPSTPVSSPSPAVTATHTNVDPAAWLFTMCGFGIRAASTAFEAQVAWATTLARLPPMAMALRQQIALNELAMTLVTPSAVTRAGFH